MRWWGLIILAWMGYMIVMDVFLIRDQRAIRLELAQIRQFLEPREEDTTDERRTREPC